MIWVGVNVVCEDRPVVKCACEVMTFEVVGNVVIDNVELV